MSLTQAQLDAMSRTQLVERFDQSTAHVQFGAGFWREEIFRRDFAEQNATLLRMTSHIRWLTVVIGLLTVVNVALVSMSQF